MVHSKGQNCFLRLLTQKTSKILNCPDSVLREAKSARGKKFCLVHGLVQILILLFFFFFLGLKFSPTARTVNVQKKRAPPIGPMNLFVASPSDNTLPDFSNYESCRQIWWRSKQGLWWKTVFFVALYGTLYTIFCTKRRMNFFTKQLIHIIIIWQVFDQK